MNEALTFHLSYQLYLKKGTELGLLPDTLWMHHISLHLDNLEINANVRNAKSNYSIT